MVFCVRVSYPLILTHLVKNAKCPSLNIVVTGHQATLCELDEQLNFQS
jgi:hypothetical protein